MTREKVEVTVLSEGKHGFLGLGGEKAVVRVETLESVPDEGGITSIAKNVLTELLYRMGVDASVVMQAQELDDADDDVTPISFDIRGEDLGILIGRRGQTLACLQFILRLIVSRQTTAWVPLTVDVESYRQRRSEKLKALAERLAEQVSNRRSPFTLEPMAPYERRIIHLTLANHPGVITESTGEGESRKVVIRPKKR